MSQFDRKTRNTHHRLGRRARLGGCDVIWLRTNNYTLLLKLNNGTEIRDVEGEEKPYHIPVTFHNLRGYDAHHIIRHLKHDLVYETDVSVIPNNSERYVSFEISKLRFINSCQFLSSKLSTLVKNLPKDNCFTTQNGTCQTMS